MNYIKIFQNAKTLSVSVGDNYSEYQLMHAYRTDNRRCFILCLVFALVYPSIAENLVTLATLRPWSDSFCTHN